MKIDIYHHYQSNKVIAKLDAILSLLQEIKKKEVEIMATITDVQAKVDEQTTVVASAVTLLTSLSQMLKDALASADPAAVQKVIDGIDANKAALAEAIIANTPSA